MLKPLDVVILGQALESFGLTANKTVEGLGIITAGFLWPCNGIWSPSDDSITTAWVSCSEVNSSVELCSD